MLSHFLSPTKNIKKHVRFMLFFGSIFAAADIATVEAFRYLTGALEMSDVDVFSLAIVAMFVIESIDLLFHRWFKQKDRKAVFAIDKEVYSLGLRNYLGLDHNYADKLGLGRLQSIYQRGLSVRTRFIYRVHLEGGKILITVVGALGMLFLTNLWIGLGSLIVMGIIIGVFLLRNTKEREFRTRAKQKEIELSKVKVMQMMSKFEILQSDRIDYELDRYNAYADDLTQIHLDKAIYNLLAYHITFSVFNYIKIIAYGVAGYIYFVGNISLADFFVIALSFRLLSNILGNIRTNLREYSKDIVHLEKLRDVMEQGPKLVGIDTGVSFTSSANDIRVKNITFGYDDENKVFKKFSCICPGGQKTALVGISGSGKSTLIKLIAGYLRPQSGDIIIGNQSLSDISLKSYYQHVGYLTQDPLIFDGTILENLTYALDASIRTEQEMNKKIDKAIKLAKCDFIYDFPHGIETEIGERGIRLSGGQRQRLAIAKVFLKDPSIILLDEPTSALDSFSEEAITQAMHTLFEGRTVIIIAHRLQTVKEADKIFVFDEGTIVEEGTHDSLVKQGGAYAKMLDLQSGF